MDIQAGHHTKCWDTCTAATMLQHFLCCPPLPWTPYHQVGYRCLAWVRERLPLAHLMGFDGKGKKQGLTLCPDFKTLNI